MVAEYYTYNILPNENLAHGTIELYERQYRNIVSKQAFCIMPLRDLRRSDLQTFFNRLAKEKSASSVQATSKYMHRLFRWLESEGYCDNLMNGIVAKKRAEIKENDNLVVFSDNEVKAITQADNRLHFLFVLAFATGMRLGELLAVKYSDFRNGSVTVSRQLNEHYVIQSDAESYYEASVTDTKSKSSRRTIPIPPSVQSEFERHKATHKEEMVKNGYRTDYLFTTSTGTFISKGNFRRAWIRHLHSCGIQYQKFHTCRATYCTMLCRNGVPLETASKLMGHADVSVTARYYRLISDEEMRDAVEKIDSIFRPVGDNLAIDNK